MHQGTGDCARGSPLPIGPLGPLLCLHSGVHPGALATATTDAGGGLSIIKYSGYWTLLLTASGMGYTPNIGCGVPNMARLGK